MAHLTSIIFFIGLLAGLATLLQWTLAENGRAIRAALAGQWSSGGSIEGALDRLGACLRASFPALDRDARSPDLDRLLARLSAESRPAAR